MVAFNCISALLITYCYQLTAHKLQRWLTRQNKWYERDPAWTEEIKLEGEWGRWINKDSADLNGQNTHPGCVCVTLWNKLWSFCFCYESFWQIVTQSINVEGLLILQTMFRAQLSHNYTCRSFGHFRHALFFISSMRLWGYGWTGVAFKTCGRLWPLVFPLFVPSCSASWILR